MSEQNYDDIIDLPHHVSTKHTPMPRESRAMQFAPFAALTGYDASVKEEARLTEQKLILTDEEADILNCTLAFLSADKSNFHTVNVTHFLPDKQKSGGKYIKTEGVFHSVDEIEGILSFTDKRKIPLTDILSVEIISEPKKG